ncbi:hypothetical protein M0R36_09720, partial [bacterium]|nr:hypothetical protein [bacterium]
AEIHYNLIDFKYLYGPIEECLTLTIECECSFCGWNDTYYNENFYLDSKYSANKELFDILTIRELPFKIKTIVR